MSFYSNLLVSMHLSPSIHLTAIYYTILTAKVWIWTKTFSHCIALTHDKICTSHSIDPLIFTFSLLVYMTAYMLLQCGSSWTTLTLGWESFSYLNEHWSESQSFHLKLHWSILYPIFLIMHFLLHLEILGDRTMIVRSPWNVQTIQSLVVLDWSLFSLVFF